LLANRRYFQNSRLDTKMKAKKSDNLLSRERLSPPKIDLARLGKSSDLDPFTLVQNLSPDEFEIFIYEWLFASERYDQNEIYRLGGAGDKGRDLLARDAGNAFFGVAFGVSRFRRDLRENFQRRRK
jgi:hypothetical protein